MNQLSQRMMWNIAPWGGKRQCVLERTISMACLPIDQCVSIENIPP
jgi:hypothetical protein